MGLVGPNLDWYQRNDLIGTGKYGNVCKFTLKEEYEKSPLCPKWMAVKSISLLHVKDQSWEPNMCHFVHKNIVQFYGVETITDIIHIKMEVARHNLKKFQTDFCGGPIIGIDFLYLALQISEGVEYLHLLDYAHCNIKPQNILVFWPGDAKNPPISHVVLKLCDFALSRAIQCDAEAHVYLPPEFLASLEENSACRVDYRKVDMFSCGVVFSELLSYKIPHKRDDHLLNTKLAVEKLRQTDVLQSLTNECVGLLSQMLALNSGERINASYLVTIIKSWYNETLCKQQLLELQLRKGLNHEELNELMNELEPQAEETQLRQELKFLEQKTAQLDEDIGELQQQMPNITIKKEKVQELNMKLKQMIMEKKLLHTMEQRVNSARVDRDELTGGTNLHSANDGSLAIEMNRPLEFITTGDDNKLHINKNVVEYLSKIYKKVTVISIAGEARKGKSFLMNMLFGKNSGFPIGSTINSTTKGIWIWIREHPRDKSRMLILLDTEGLGDPTKHNLTHDRWIFTLALLLGSAFVYNSQGSINRQALDYLELAAEMSKHITKGITEGDNRECIREVFPELIWVLRDFFLDLHSSDGREMSPDEYLEDCLRLDHGHSRAIQNYNNIKNAVCEFFPKRRLFILPRPVDEHKMKIIDTLNTDDLDIRFRDASTLFTEYVMDHVKNKTIDGTEITTSFFASLAEKYVSLVHKGIVPIDSAVDAVRESNNRKALDLAADRFNSNLKKLDIPLAPDELRKQVKIAYDRARESFFANAFGLSKGGAEELLGHLEERAILFEDENVGLCEAVCQEYLDFVYWNFEKKIHEGTYLKPGGHKTFRLDVDKFQRDYWDNARISSLGELAEGVLKRFMDAKVDIVNNLILESDNSLSEKERQLLLMEQKNETIKRNNDLQRKEQAQLKAKIADIERQRVEDEHRLKEEQRRELEAELKNQREHLEQMSERAKKLLCQGQEEESNRLNAEIGRLREQVISLATRPVQIIHRRRRGCVVM